MGKGDQNSKQSGLRKRNPPSEKLSIEFEEGTTENRKTHDVEYCERYAPNEN